MPRSPIRIFFSRGLAASVLALQCGCVFTSERPVAVDVKADVASAYLFRGQVMTDRPVLQPSTEVHLPTRGGGTTSLKAWGNMDLTENVGSAWMDRGHAGEFTETDATATYGQRVGPLDVAVGLVHYSWNHGEAFRFGDFPATTEVFASCSGEVMGFVPTVTAHYDIDAVEGIYVRGDLAREVELAEDLRLVLQGGVGWSDELHSLWLYRRKTNAISDAEIAATLVWDADELTSVHAGVHGSTIVDSELRDWFRPRIDADNVWFSAGVTWAF